MAGHVERDEPIPSLWVRDGETTIKINLQFWGGGLSGQRGKSAKTLFFVGNATTTEF